MVSASITGTTFVGMSVASNHQEIQVNIDKEKLFSNIEEKKSFNKVVINDPQSGDVTGISLSDENLRAITERFGASDIKQHAGFIELTGQAEAFVSSWYGDIAYNRAFLESDRNADGKLDESEYNNTKNHVTYTIDFEGDEENFKYREKVFSTYRQSSCFNDNCRMNGDYKRPDSLMEELNRTISQDNDFNQKLSLRELANRDSSNVGLTDTEIALKTMNYLKREESNSTIYDTFVSLLKEDIERFQKDKNIANNLAEEKKLELARESMDILINAEGDDSKLNEEEKQSIRGVIEDTKKQMYKEVQDMNILDLNV